MRVPFTRQVEEAIAGRRSPFSAHLLVVIKAVHTLIWAVFVLSILAIWLFIWRQEMLYALMLIGVVGLECLVLIVNNMRCPISSLARRLTNDPSANFDIYLPAWLAAHTRLIFGSMFAGAVITALATCVLGPL